MYTQLHSMGLLAVLSTLSACRSAEAEAPSEGAVTPQAAQAPAMQVDGVTYAMAQQLRWLSPERFLVGRWDGSIGVFSASKDQSAAPTLESALVVPGGHGVQMLVVHSPERFVSSGSDHSLLIWRRDAAGGGRFEPQGVDFPPDHGVAVSGLFVAREGREFLLTGHEHGHLLVWAVGQDGALGLEKTIDLRSEVAIDYQHADAPLRHLRGLAEWRDGLVVVGGEDGALHQVRIPSGEVVSNRLFNPSARLGVNDLAVHGDQLLVVNCSVDSADHNLWLYDLHPDHIANRDQVNLLAEPDGARIFAFDVVTWDHPDGPMAAVTTKEGLLWQVALNQDGLEPLEHLALGRFTYASAIDLEPETHRVAAAGVGVRVVSLEPEL